MQNRLSECRIFDLYALTLSFPKWQAQHSREWGVTKLSASGKVDSGYVGGCWSGGGCYEMLYIYVILQIIYVE